MPTSDGITHYTLSTWKQFKLNLYTRLRSMIGPTLGSPTAFPNDLQRFIFRGQACKSWGLESAFDRRFKTRLAGGGSLDIDNEYKLALKAYVEDCEYHGISDAVPPSLTPGKYLEQAGQHHGFPTRLLDWSISPYVAAFFAFVEERHCRSGYVSVWALDRIETARCLRNTDIEIVINPTSNNPRMRTQSGLFTKNWTNLLDMQDVFRVSSKRYLNHPSHPVLIRFDIPVADSTEAINDLELMGLDYIRLFPGIEGICRHHEYITWRNSR